MPDVQLAAQQAEAALPCLGLWHSLQGTASTSGDKEGGPALWEARGPSLPGEWGLSGLQVWLPVSVNGPLPGLCL